MDIHLRYGSGHLDLTAPDRNVLGVYRPRANEGPTLAPATCNPADARKLRVALTGVRGLLLLPDSTRSLDDNMLIDSVRAFATAASLTVAIATGSHRSDTAGNRAIRDRVTECAHTFDVPLKQVVLHDCHEAEFGPARLSVRGHRIRLSTILQEADAVLVVSDVKHHYFAGYSNPLKFFLPGLADFASIEANHRLTLEPEAMAGRHPLHPDPSRRSNPIAEEMLEIFRAEWGGRPAFAMTQVRAAGHVAHREVAELEAACANAFVAADRVSSIQVPPGRHVVISAGGAPQDSTLYLCQRAVELTKSAIAANAQVLLVAECRDGLTDTDAARENFYVELQRPLPDILERIRDGYRLYQHKAYRFAELLSRVSTLHLASSLPDAEVRAIHFHPASSAQQVLDEWIAEEPECKITFLDEANRLTVTGVAA